MNIEALRSYCLGKVAVTEGFPFDDTTLVFKVADKMFALTSTDIPFTVNLKCEPERALLLRETYAHVKPGYHMNKKHWNTIELTGDVPDDLIRQWIDDSYQLVVESLSKKVRLAYNLI